MSEPTRSVASIGLHAPGPMGQDLAARLTAGGLTVATWSDAPADPARLVAELERPRRVLLVVEAGPPVDALVDALAPHLSPGDVVLHGGNEHFRETARRCRQLEAAGVHFLGVGIGIGRGVTSRGRSLAVGGSRAGFEAARAALEAIAVPLDDGPCVELVGPDGAGHFVKLTQLGFEFAELQLIAEVYDLLRHVGGLSVPELGALFASWHADGLDSVAMRAAARVLEAKDDLTGQPLVDVIADSSDMKPPARWMAQECVGLGVPAPTVVEAVNARFASVRRAERVAAAAVLPPPAAAPVVAATGLVADARDALETGLLCAAAQTFSVCAAASAAHGWNLELARVARVARAGCAVASTLFHRVELAFRRTADLPLLLLDPGFAAEVVARAAGCRRAVALATAAGFCPPALSASLAWLDGVRRDRLPAALIYGQRNYVAGMPYERVDRPGGFRTEWSSS